jgi:mRNA interferase RelE/StbE
MSRHIFVKWTATAKKHLSQLPPDVAIDILRKVTALRDCDDPRQAGKPLLGPLQGYYRLSVGRYRVIFTMDEEELANGDVIVNITVTIVAVGIRKERDKKDVYRLAQRLVALGQLYSPPEEDSQ